MKRGFGIVFKPAATRHFHSYDGYAFNVVILYDFAKFFGIIYVVKLRAAYQSNFPFHKVGVHICVGVRGAIGGDKKLRAVKILGVRGYEPYLARPLIKLGNRSAAVFRLLGSVFLVLELHHTTAGATGMVYMRALLAHFLPFVFENGFFVVSLGFSFRKGYRARGAGGQTIAQTVAIIVAKKLRLSVYYTDRAFVARLGARAATVGPLPLPAVLLMF